MEDKEIKALVRKYLEGYCTKEERETVETWYLNEVDQLRDELAQPDYDASKKEIWNKIADQRNIKVQKQYPFYRITAVAAAIFLVVGVGVYFFAGKTATEDLQESLYVNDVQPGGNKAYLTLANGKQITLTDAANGKLAEESGVKVTKAADGKLIYSISDALASKGDKGLNTITTPKGGKYEVVLSDGSRVLLNAA
jgi:transmembrane sensor